MQSGRPHSQATNLPCNFAPHVEATIGTIARREVDTAHCPDQGRRRSAPAQRMTRRPSRFNMSNHHILDHKGTIVMCPQFQVLSDFVSAHLPKAPPTDEQIMDFIEERLAPFRNLSTQQNGDYGATPLNEESQIREDTDCNLPEPTNVIHLPTTSFSNEENVQRQSHNVSTEQHTATRGQTLIKDHSMSSKPNAELTFKHTVTRDCATVASDTHSAGTLRSVVKHSRHSHKNEFLMERTCIGNMSVRKDLDVLPNAAGIQKDIVSLHYSLTSLKELIASLENAEIVAKVDNISELILQQYWNKDLGNARLFTPTEYPQIMRNVAAACAKTEDASPMVLATLAEMSPDSPSDKSVSDGLLTCSSTKEKYRSSWLNLNKTLDNTDKMPGLSWTPKSSNNQKKEKPGPKTAEDVQLDSLKRVTNTSMVQTQLISVLSEHNTLKLKTLDAEDANGKIGQCTEQPQYFQIVFEDVTSQSKINIGKNADSVEFPDQTAPSMKCLKCPKYEDILDDQHASHQVTNQACVQVPLYEDISEDEEPQIKNIAVKARLLRQVPANSNETSNLEHEGPGYGDDDYDKDDEWLVIPLSVEDLDFEPENFDEEQEDVELIVLYPEKAAGAGRWNATRPAQCRVHHSDSALTVASSQIEVFDTFDSFVKAKSKQLGFCKSTPPDELHSDAKPYNAQDIKESDSEPEESCETDDSCDYSSATERNRLTVDRRLLKGVSVPAPSDLFLFEHKGRTRRHKCEALLNSRNESMPKASETNDIIVLYSDTDDESDQMRRTPLFLSSEGGGSSCHRSSLPFESNFGLEQVKHSTNGPNVSTQQIINLDSDTDSCGSVNGQLIEYKEHNKGANRPRIAKKPKFHSFCKVVKKDGICKKKPSVARTVLSVSDGGSSTSFAVQNKLATKMANHHTDSERPQKTTSKRSSKDSSGRLPQSVSKKACPDNPVTGRLFVAASSEPGSHLKLSKEPKSRLDEEERKTHTKTISASGSDNNRTANKPLASLTKPKPASRQMSNEEHPSLSISNSTTASGQFPQVRQRSASEGLTLPATASALSSIPKPSTSVPTQQLSSSKLKRSHSYSSASTLEYPKTLSKDLPCSTRTQSFAKKRLRSEWHDSFVPTKLDRRPSSGTEKPLKNKSWDSSGQARPGPSHQSRQMTPRHRYVNKSATPLMKRTKQEAIQRTKDINRTMSSGPRNIVGKHYKWAEEQRPAKVASGWKRKRL